MKTRKKFDKGLVLFYIFLLLMVFCSCAPKRELNELGIVMITGVDYITSEKQYEVTVYTMMPVPGGVAVGGEVGKGQILPWVSSAKADTIMEASKNLRVRSPGDLTWLHSQVIIIGEEAARRDLDAVMDFFSRNREIRYTSYVYVCPGKAREILKLTPQVSTSLPAEIVGITENLPEWGKASVPMLKKVLESLESEYSDPLLSMIKSGKPEPFDKQPIEEIGNRKASDMAVALEGSAVVQYNRMVGWLTGLETRGYRWVMGKRGDVFVSGYADGNDLQGKVSVELTIKNNKRTVQIQPDGTLTFQLLVELDGLVTENSTSMDLSRMGQTDILEKQMEELVKKEIQDLLLKVQGEYHADVLELGKLVYMKSPGLWREIRGRWREQIYPAVPVEIQVKCKIAKLGMIS